MGRKVLYRKQAPRAKYSEGLKIDDLFFRSVRVRGFKSFGILLIFFTGHGDKGNDAVLPAAKS